MILQPESQFHVILRTDQCEQLSNGSFYYMLPSPIVFGSYASKWEVSLSRLDFNPRFINVKNDFIEFEEIPQPPEENEVAQEGEPPVPQKRYIVLPNSACFSPYDLKSLIGSKRLTYNKTKKKFTLNRQQEIRDRGEIIRFSHNLNTMLGFHFDQNFYPGFSYQSINSPNFTIDHKFIYLYLDILDCSISGDKLSPLLLVVPYREPIDSSVLFSYIPNKLAYFPVNKNSLMDLTFRFVSETESPFELLTTDVPHLIHLHFRRRRLCW